MGFKEYIIEDCCDILNNLRFPLNAEQRFDMQGEYPYYGANGVQGYINQWRFDDDLILIAEDGGNFEQFDRRPIAYRVSGKCWVNNHAHVLKAKPNFSQSFIFYSLEHKNILFFIAGGTRSKLTQGELKKITIAHPEKLVADKIGIILEKADAAIAQTEALIAKYQRIKTGLMQDLLTRGIDEHGNIRSEQTHRFKTEKGLRVPEEWEVVELESVCHKIADRDHTTPVYVADGVFIVSPKDFNELHEIDFTKCQRITLEAHLINRRKTNIEVDDLIFTRIGAGLGKICKVTAEMPEFSILHSACMLKPNQDKILSDFLMYYIKSEFAQKQIVDGIQSIGVPDLGMDKIRTFLVKKPKTLDEQVKVLKPQLKLDNLIRKETAELSKQKSLKTGLMQDLLSGKVRVTVKEETLVNP